MVNASAVLKLQSSKAMRAIADKVVGEMMNRNEKGQISPAQSRIAKIMREGQSAGRRVETKVLTKQKRISEAVGRQYRQSQAEPKKREIVARGQKDAYRRSWLKGYSAVRKGKG